MHSRNTDNIPNKQQFSETTWVSRSSNENYKRIRHTNRLYIGLVDEIVLQLFEKSYSYSRLTGSLTILRNIPELTLLNLNYTQQLHFTDIAFTQLIMHNWTEFETQVSLNEILGSIGYHDKILRQLGVSRSKSDRENAVALSGDLWSPKKGHFRLFKRIQHRLETSMDILLLRLHNGLCSPFPLLPNTFMP